MDETADAEGRGQQDRLRRNRAPDLPNLLKYEQGCCVAEHLLQSDGTGRFAHECIEASPRQVDMAVPPHRLNQGRKQGLETLAADPVCGLPKQYQRVSLRILVVPRTIAATRCPADGSQVSRRTR